jgi:hypothetical protein
MKVFHKKAFVVYKANRESFSKETPVAVKYNQAEKTAVVF